MRQRNVKNKEEIITSSKYFVNNPENYIEKWSSYFQNNNPIYIEIGMGKGQFIIENAKRYPNINFIGIEKYDSILALALKKINIELPNLVMLRLDAFNIDSIFKEEIDTIYLNFSDPWPKKRHAKRRLTSPEFLKKYDLIFKNNNHIVMKTDNKDLFSYSIKTLNNHGYYINYITFDLEKEKDSLNIMTEYEEKFTKLNNSIYKIDVIKGKK
ncbi:MAG: tRNA (guanosine(46)-N7)-methyltransferase TrmB [Bacilli bacterium]